MARPRKPTALLDISGAFKHDAQRRRPNEPADSRPLGPPPARLTKSARPFWAELVEMCAPGVLKRSDRWAVELASRLMPKAVRGRASSVELNGTRSFFLVHKTARQEVLRRSDRWAVELASRMMAKAGRGRASSAELNILRSLLASCGLTPADRTKIHSPAAKPQNAYSQLADEAEKNSRPN